MPSRAVPRQPSRCGLLTNRRAMAPASRPTRSSPRMYQTMARLCRQSTTGRMPSSRTPSSSRSTAVIQPPRAAVRAQLARRRPPSSTGSKRRCSQFMRAPVAGLRRAAAPMPCAARASRASAGGRWRRRARRPAPGCRRTRSRPARDGCGRPATRTGRSPAASDRPSAPPASPVSASASARTCGSPITRATAASCSAAVVGTGRAPRSQTSPASRSQASTVGVVLERQRPRGVAEQQRVGRRPAGLLDAGQRVAADERRVRDVLRGRPRAPAASACRRR